MKIVIALGGNAILKRGERGTAEEQVANVRTAMRHLVGLARRGEDTAITHGNGPQVGDILLKNEASKATLPPMPLDVCGAESQGMIGYIVQQALDVEMRSAGVQRPSATVLTQTVVDARDPAFKNPLKPVGPFYTAEEASRLRKENGWTVMDDSGRGYRRVVPSPDPVEIVELSVIKQLFDQGVLVVAAGGGGIPVVREGRGASLRGVEAVIDKDLTAALLARQLGAELLLILTDVAKVSLDFGKPSQRDLDEVSASDCERYLAQGQFAPGSMGPKIEASVRFLKGGGRSVVISSLEQAETAVEGRAGTTIRP